MFRPSFLGLIAALLLAAGLAAGLARAEDAVAVRVNGKDLSEADMKLAETEIGTDLGSIAGVPRRRVLAEFLVETQLFADAAEVAKLSPPANTQDTPYWKRRALRDAYFEKVIAKGIGDGEVKAFYDEHIGSKKQEEEIRASHILLDSEDKAYQVYTRLQSGGDFAAMAKEVSADPGSKEQGGDLGFFVRGQMVPEFEQAAFALKPGEYSKPFKTQFGWHIAKLEARRERKAPPFEDIKDRLAAAVVHYKAQQIVFELRSKSKIEYVDAEISKLVEAERAQSKK